MAFEVGDRVKVTDQSSHYRNKLGEVVRLDDENDLVLVRPDGGKVSDEIPFDEGALQGTTLANPIDYPE